MVAPMWAPEPDQVANYVTSRTVDLIGNPGSDEPTKTFTDTTTPSQTQVRGLIEDACAWVVMVTGTPDVTLQSIAATVAAMRAAGLVEMSYPIRNADVDSVADALLLQARLGRDDLAAANRAAGVDGPSVSAAPVFAFPDAEAWRGDQPSRFSRYSRYYGAEPL